MSDSKTNVPKVLTQIEDALVEARRLKISVDSIITALERATGFIAWASQENRRLVRDLKRDEQYEDVSSCDEGAPARPRGYTGSGDL